MHSIGTFVHEDMYPIDIVRATMNAWFKELGVKIDPAWSQENDFYAWGRITADDEGAEISGLFKLSSYAVPVGFIASMNWRGPDCVLICSLVLKGGVPLELGTHVLRRLTKHKPWHVHHRRLSTERKERLEKLLGVH